MNRMSTKNSGKGYYSGPVVTKTEERRAAAPKVTGKGKVTKSGTHGKVRIPPSLG